MAQERGRRVRRVPVALLACGLMAVGACAQEPSWQPVAIPLGEQATALAVDGASLVVATEGGAADGPGLFRVSGDQVTEVPVVATGSYSTETALRWLVGTDDGLTGVGGARGGAHANVRWTVWGTDADGRFTDHEQPFETFGGWEAGTLVGLTTLEERPVIVGSWRGSVGLDIAFWEASGKRWTRRPTPTELANDARTLRTASAVAAYGDEAILVGSEIRLSAGGVQVPTLWRASRIAGPWRAVSLSANAGRATAVSCTPTGCLIAGQDAEAALRLWWLTDAGVEQLDAAGVVLADGVTPAVAASADGGSVAASSSDGPRLMAVTRAGTTLLDPPAGTPRVLARQGDRLYLVTDAAQQPSTLWRGVSAVP